MYPYKYCVVSFTDDSYSEHYSYSFFCDLNDADDYYNTLLKSCTPCMFYRLGKFGNLKL